MKLISWNVNGLRAVMGKGFLEVFEDLDADVFCLQETKLRPEQLDIKLPGYRQYFNSADKKGYSGTAVFSKHEPLSVSYGLGIDQFDHEGRLITLEFDEFYLVNCYTPNAQRGLLRIDFRMEWEDAIRDYLTALDITKPVVYCGDLNVAHQEIDLKNPGPNRGNAGFSDQERGKMTELLEAGFVDTFRLLHPEETGAYSWWSYMYNARANNAGWRIDYFIVSSRLAEKVQQAYILPRIMGSDHCPVGLQLDVT
ncbi:MAG: exodeoxyribonuclease III [Pygmaiobacter massiliensis]|nr:exodeoxyribonuclease III [Pygmaiobacter massiliensis]